MLPIKWKLEDLPDIYRDILVSAYGRQPSDSGYSLYQIQYVRELTEHEKYLFTSKSFVSPQFLTQALYKIKGRLTPLRFNRLLREAVDRSDVLRLNYCFMGEETVAVVFQKRRQLPQVIYRNISSMKAEVQEQTIQQIMEADMREGFDLQGGNLIRFVVLHTGRDEYAILVTAAQLIMNRIDLMSFWDGIEDLDALHSFQQPAASSDEAAPRSNMKSAIRDYWMKVMDKLPDPPEVPYQAKSHNGQSKCRTYRTSIAVDIMSDIRKLTKNNKMMLKAILQTAWGILLQEYNHRMDVFFCLLVADRKEQTEPSSGSFHVMPVRCRIEKEMTVQQLVNQQFQQAMVSRP